MLKKLFRGLLILVLLAAAGYLVYSLVSLWQARRDAHERANSPQGRLPEGVAPVAYELEMRIDPRREKFNGRVAIAADVTRPTDVIWLHGTSLDVASAHVTTADGRRLAADYHEMGHSGVVRLKLPETIEAQRLSLEIAYSARLGSKLAGAYRVEEDGRSYVFTQFAAIDARLAFPCFDEPAFKTPFEVTLVVRYEDHGLANAPLVSEETVEAGWKRLRFAATEPIPTYLVAFAVGPFDIVVWQAIPPNEQRGRPLPLRGVATAGQGGKLSFALANTAPIVNLLEEYFGSAYPFAKLDIVAVPDFAAGAMENAGLVTYREQFLLLGDEPSVNEQRSYALIHAHELAHQWHGNLVTMPWWDDVWLNEAFATWMEYRTAERWNADLELGRDKLRSAHAVMEQDAYVSARQIRQPIASNHDIESAFDGITYEKGAAVLAMFESYLGEETFRAGVRAHLDRFARGSATAEDFIASIAEGSDDASVGEAFRSFLEQPGVPLVAVDWSCSEDGVDLRLGQSRYLPVGSRGSPEQTWRLPVCLRLVSDGEPRQVCTLLSEPETTIDAAGAGCPGAVMPNAGGVGYYRWSLPEAGWSAVLDSLGELSTEESYSLIDNLASELYAGRIDVGFYLEAVGHVVALDAWDLVLAPSGDLKYIANYIVPESRRQEMLSYIEDLYEPRYRQVGLTADTDLDRADPVATALLRSRLVSFLALDARSSSLRRELVDLARAYIGFETGGTLDPEAVHPDLVTTALTAGLEELGKPFYRALLAQVEDSNDSSFRQKAIRAMGQVTEEELAEEVRGLVLSLSLRLNEKATVVFGQMRDPRNQQPLFDFVTRYYGVVAPFLPDSYLSGMPMIASNFCDMEAHEAVREFFEPRLQDVLGGPHTLANVLERIELCAALVEAQQDFAVPSTR